MLSHTVAWGARQGVGRALAVPRSGSAGWVILLSLRTRAASPELHPSTLYPAGALAAGRAEALPGIPRVGKAACLLLTTKAGS